MSWASGAASSAGSAASSAAPAAVEAAGSAASSAAPAATAATSPTSSLPYGLANAGTGGGPLKDLSGVLNLSDPSGTLSKPFAATGKAIDAPLDRFASGMSGNAPATFGNNAETYGYFTGKAMRAAPQQPSGFSLQPMPGGNNPYRKTGRY